MKLRGTIQTDNKIFKRFDNIDAYLKYFMMDVGPSFYVKSVKLSTDASRFVLLNGGEIAPIFSTAKVDRRAVELAQHQRASAFLEGKGSSWILDQLGYTKEQVLSLGFTSKELTPLFQSDLAEMQITAREGHKSALLPFMPKPTLTEACSMFNRFYGATLLFGDMQLEKAKDVKNMGDLSILVDFEIEQPLISWAQDSAR